MVGTVSVEALCSLRAITERTVVGGEDMYGMGLLKQHILVTSAPRGLDSANRTLLLKLGGIHGFAQGLVTF